MKGVSPILASVLVVLVAISLSGAFLIFTQNTSTQLTEESAESQKQLQAQLDVRFSIEAAADNTVFIRNTGTVNVTNESLTVFLGDRLIGHKVPSEIPPGTVGEVELIDTDRAGIGRKNLRISGQSLSDGISVSVRSDERLVTHMRLDETGTIIINDSSANGNGGTLNAAVGESGTVQVSSGEWETISFTRSYSDPIVLATANTADTGEHPLIPQARNVDADSAQVRLCNHDNAEGCDSSAGVETLGYVVLDLEDIKPLDGVDAGSVTIPASGGENAEVVSFTESFSNEPVVFATPNTANNASEAFATWVFGKNTSSATITRCNHDEDSEDDCEAHDTDETIAWMAVDPDNVPFFRAYAGQSSTTFGSSWASDVGELAVFPDGFDSTPVGLAMIQDNNGGQDPKVSEARDVTTTSMDYRFCEHDLDEICDGHAGNFQAWFAVESTGTILAKETFTDGVHGGAIEFDGSDDYVNVSSDAFDLSQENEVTLEAWVNVSGSGNRYIFSNARDCCGSYGGYNLQIKDGDRLEGHIWDGSGRQDVVTDFTSYVGVMTHVAMTANETHLSLFINGEEVESETRSRDIGEPSFPSNIGKLASHELYYFNGTIDDVRVFDDALSEDELMRDPDQLYIVNSA